MHLLRDGHQAKRCWLSSVKSSKTHILFSLQGEEWIRWNLSQEAGLDITKRVSWPVFFGYCAKIFGLTDVVGYLVVDMKM